MKFSLKRPEILFLILIFLAGAALRLIPRLPLDPHLLTFQADIWYRLCLAQYLIDNGHLPPWDIRYLAYGHVPLWYNPGSIYFFAILHWITRLDLPTVCSRLMPFIEALSIIPTYFLCRELYNKRVAVIASTLFLLSPSYIFWAGISTLQSFTIFLLPITILLWVRFLEGQPLFRNKWAHLGTMGALLAVNFLVHLSFFTHIIILFFVQLGLFIEKRSRWRDFLYLLAPVAISLWLTAIWWLPKNLFWWWSRGLTTSSGLTEGLRFLAEYGTSSAIIGHLAFAGLIVYIIWKRRAAPPYFLIPVFWALFPMVESHNEGILNLIHRTELTWNNLCKPLESFRFFLFLAQPLAICFALLADKAAGLRVHRAVPVLIAVALGAVLVYDMFYIYKLPERFANSGMEVRDIHAAQWFREHSKPTDRVLTEYYTAQMVSGICGGKALLGSMFPLKGVHIPYISIEEGNVVQDDIYSVYKSYDLKTIEQVLARYGCTHIYVSDRAIWYIEMFLQMRGTDIPGNAPEDASKIDKKKMWSVFSDTRHFKVVYRNEDVAILEWRGGEQVKQVEPIRPAEKPKPAVRTSAPASK